MASWRSDEGSTPRPGPDGTAIIPPGRSTKGSVRSSGKYLALALMSPGRVNPGNEARARLAARTLDPATVHRWFEVGRDPRAPATYRERVRDALAKDDVEFWDARIGIITTGLHEHAGVGRPFLRLGRLARIVRPGLANAIETTPDPLTQADWWRRHVRPRLFGPLTHMAFARTRVLAPLAPNPIELERMRRTGWSHGLADRIDGVVASVLVRRHPWWRPALSGRPADIGDGAAWLDVASIRALALGDPHLELVRGELTSVLATLPAGSLTAASVSNVPDWLPAPATASLATAARRALAPGGRLLVRRIVRPGGGDPFVMAGFLRDGVSDVLLARERTALYEAVELYRVPAS